jgi:4-diphosphocytidyl-2-C-methyl-D-erythritol kinase
MIAFPHAKINLGLSIVKKRPDGFHALETVFYPIPVRDCLEIVNSAENIFSTSGLPISGNEKDNLILRAYHLFKQRYPWISPLEIHLLKAIPMGAGLGGGSSDAAAMIRLVQRLFNIPLTSEERVSIAMELGSDCPFFMQSSPCYATGRGEILEPVTLDLSAYSLLLIHPELKVETAWAYSRIIPASARFDLREIILKPVSQWRAYMRNDFESPVFARYPVLEHYKNQLYAAGAQYAAMTGSGSTIFGIFEKGTLPEMVVENAGQTHIG